MTQPVRPAGAPFLRLQGDRDWAQAVRREQTFFDEAAGGLRLGDANATAILPAEPGGTFGGITRPTGLAVGSDGRLFVADPNGDRILTYTTATAAFVPLWSPPATSPLPQDVCRPAPPVPPLDPYTLREPRGVAISRDGDLAVADTGHSRVIIYTWPGLAVRHIVELGAGKPCDVAYDSRGYLYVADSAAQRVRLFDRLWRPLSTYAGGAGVLVSPKHLAIDGDDRVLVLDAGPQAIVELDGKGQAVAAQSAKPVGGVDGQPLPPLAPSLSGRTLPPPLRLDARGLWLPQDDRPDCLALLLPGITVDRRGRLPDSGVMLLARPITVRYPRTGSLITGALDSGIYNCVWHRIVLDVEIPVATSLSVRTLTAQAAWEPSRIQSLPESLWSSPLTLGPDDSPEILVQSPTGRFLWIDLQFSSNGAATPLLRAITVYAPRSSSLGYLPPVFREDPVSADFLDRMLSYFDIVFDEIENQIDRFSGYLDPDGVPPGDFLAWLGSWLDIEFLAEWPDRLRREFVRRAIGLYKKRGTVAGLQAILRLHASLAAPQPIVLEHFRLRDYAARWEVGADRLVNGQLYIAGLPLNPGADGIAHHFTVIAPASAAVDDDALATLHRLIEAQKPAHTEHSVRLVEPGVRIGCQSTIGVDMLIGVYPAAPLGEMALSQNSQLAPPAAPYPRLGSSRLAFEQ